MKILMINVTCGTGSTGRICTDLADALEKEGHIVKIAYGRDKVPKKYEKYAVRIGNNFDVYTHFFQSYILDKMGFGSKNATKAFIEWIKFFNPDIIHIHNIHGYYINIEELFNYLKISKKKIIWTLHDCWSFTGHCAFFDFVKCDKWKNECKECINKREYPVRIGIDCSRYNYSKKKNLFTNVADLTIVTPSRWLADIVSQSFLKEYEIKVINNGVNLDAFHPVKTDIRKSYNISQEKKIVLGVASVWDKRKGLEDFIKLNKLLNNEYQIVLIGLNKKQIDSLPETILGIERTESVRELVEWYSDATVYVNLTYEDNYPTTNIEAIACGTPVITYNTGGSSESAEYYGNITKKKSPKEVAELIIKAKYLKKEDIDISYKKMLKSYILIYKSL